MALCHGFHAAPKEIKSICLPFSWPTSSRYSIASRGVHAGREELTDSAWGPFSYYVVIWQICCYQANILWYAPSTYRCFDLTRAGRLERAGHVFTERMAVHDAGKSLPLDPIARCYYLIEQASRWGLGTIFWTQWWSIYLSETLLVIKVFFFFCLVRKGNCLSLALHFNMLTVALVLWTTVADATVVKNVYHLRKQWKAICVKGAKVLGSGGHWASYP